MRHFLLIVRKLACPPCSFGWPAIQIATPLETGSSGLRSRGHRCSAGRKRHVQPLISWLSVNPFLLRAGMGFCGRNSAAFANHGQEGRGRHQGELARHVTFNHGSDPQEDMESRRLGNPGKSLQTQRVKHHALLHQPDSGKPRFSPPHAPKEGTGRKPQWLLAAPAPAHSSPVLSNKLTTPAVSTAYQPGRVSSPEKLLQAGFFRGKLPVEPQPEGIENLLFPRRQVVLRITNLHH